MTGHMLGAAGAVEFIVGALAMRDCDHSADDQLPHARSRAAISTTRRTRRCKRDVRAVLSNSFGFGGHNVTLAIKRFEE